MNKAPKQRRRAEKSGRRAETLAAIYLRLLGFSILARRFRTRLGEIDVIARRGTLVVFAEIKARKNIDDAVLAVHQQARHRITAAAGLFLSKNPDLAYSTMRYDIIAIAGWRIRHVKDAWREGL